MPEQGAMTAIAAGVRERPILFTGAMVRKILAGEKSQTRRLMNPQPPEWCKEFGYTCFTPKGCISGRGRYGDHEPAEKFFKSPFGKRGDFLWVREGWCWYGRDTGDGVSGGFQYRADLSHRTFTDFTDPDARWHDFIAAREIHNRWRRSIFMPRWASRLTLEITDIRVERLQGITEEDALAEGCEAVPWEQWYEGKKPMCDGTRVRQEYRGKPPEDWTEIEPLNDYDPMAHSARDDYRRLWNSLNGKKCPWDASPFVDHPKRRHYGEAVTAATAVNMPSRGQSSGSRAALSSAALCARCGRRFSVRGLGHHQAVCNGAAAIHGPTPLRPWRECWRGAEFSVLDALIQAGLGNVPQFRIQDVQQQAAVAAFDPGRPVHIADERRASEQEYCPGCGRPAVRRYSLGPARRWFCWRCHRGWVTGAELPEGGGEGR